MGKEWIAILNRKLREGLTERHLKKSLKEVRERAVQIYLGEENSEQMEQPMQRS